MKISKYTRLINVCLFSIQVCYTFKNNEAETQDGFFSYTPDGDETEFIGVDTVSQEISSIGTDGPLFNMRFVKDSRSKSYERSVFNFLEVTGNMGGLFEILEICGGIIVGLFSGQTFLYSILPKLYQVDDPKVEDDHHLPEIIENKEEQQDQKNKKLDRKENLFNRTERKM